MTGSFSAEGGCACKRVRYRLNARPLFVHCCHCRWCQRETGAAFALNAMIEMTEVELLGDDTVAIDTPSESGRGQKIHRCPDCHVALWSHYGGAGPAIAFVRVGTLDEPGEVPPDIQIYTASKQPWAELSHAMPAVKGYYKMSEYWPEDSIDRLKAAKEAYAAAHG